MSSASSDRLVYDNNESSNASVVAELRRAKYQTFKVFKPPFVLALFVMMNFWTYYDRGCMATAIGTIRSDKTIAGSTPVSETDAGFLVSVFMVGYLVASPIFAGLGGTFSAKTIIIIGLITWTIACLVTGLIHGFWWLLATRAFVGVGEAAYAGYTVTIVDNMANPAQRTLWIGTFYSMIPVGTAIGMAMGGTLSAKASTADMSGWRWCFLTETIPMAVVVIFMCFLPTAYNPVKAEDTTSGKVKRAAAAEEEEDGGLPPGEDAAMIVNSNTTSTTQDRSSPTTAVSTPRPVGSSGSTDGDEFVQIIPAIQRLLCTPEYIFLVLGYGTYTFVLGAISVWAVSMMTLGPLKMDEVEASVFLGAVVAFTGMIGTLAGGIVVDKLGGSLGFQGVYKCSVFNTAMILVSLPTGMIALLSPSFPLFAVFFVLSVLSLFAVTAPLNSAILTAVPKNLRTYAVTLSITIMHSLGDVPSPVIAGAISDSFDSGCSANKAKEPCQMSVQGSSCVWSPASNSSHVDAFCTNEYQLRNSMLIIYSCMVLAIPLWGVVALRLRKRGGTADAPDDLDNRALLENVSRLSLKNFDQHE